MMSQSNLKISNMLSLQHLLNSFVRDFAADERVTLEDSLKLKLKEGDIVVGINEKSSLGLHVYNDSLTLNSNKISFEEFVKLLSSNFAKSSEMDSFYYKVISSRDSLREILDFNGSSKIRNYLDSEKMLLKGHPLHPFPKYRGGMNPQQRQEYCPEQRGEFNLQWISVPKDYICSNLSPSDYREMIASLVAFDLGDVDESLYLVPMHPWQWNRIKKHYAQQLGAVQEYRIGRKSFHSLSSVRSLYNVDAPLLPKFSMDLTITNSIRHLQFNEVGRSQQIERVFNKIRKTRINLNILTEPFFVALNIKDKDEVKSIQLKETIVQFRENFEELTDLDNTFLLSSLCEINPHSGDSLGHEQIREISIKRGLNQQSSRKLWFSSFLTNIIRPFIDLYHFEGVLLGAHMQNIIITTEDNLPSKVTYRDCQGTGFNKKGYEKYKSELGDKDNGNILKDDDVNKVFGYYLIVNSVFNSIAAIAKSQSSIEYELLNEFRKFIYDLNVEYKGDRFLEYLLGSSHIYQKGNSRCTILGINESTSNDPWSIYNKMPNPLVQLRNLGAKRNGTLYRAKTKKGQNISFRVINESDLDTFHSWHHQDFVSEFWELNLEKEELRNYIDKLLQSSYQLPLIFEVEGKPVGYFEAYWAYDDRIAPYCNADIFDRGIHLLIGERKYLRTRIVYDALLHVSKFLLEDNPNTKKVWGEPRADNANILKLAKALPGWEFINFFDFPHKRAALLECDKQRFYRDIDHAL